MEGQQPLLYQGTTLLSQVKLPQTSVGQQLQGKNLLSIETLNAFNFDSTNWTKVILQHSMTCNASLLDTTYNIVVWDSEHQCVLPTSNVIFLIAFSPLQTLKLTELQVIYSWKDWLAAALKVIKQIQGKGVWVECLESEAGNKQIVPCT